jgi:23S rRNA (pseudouridine1915-N3)-methyltransferase
MKVTILAIGKTIKSYLVEGEKDYENRLKHYLKLDEIILPELKQTSNLTVEEIKQKEGILLLSKLKTSDTLILLDEQGQQYTSEGFSDWIAKHQMKATKNMVLVIGGAYGFSDDVYARAQEKIALSKMTFSHQMVRLILKEQLYRAMTILKGEPYHHK